MGMGIGIGRWAIFLAAGLCALSAAPLHAQEKATESTTVAVPNLAMTFSASYIAEDMGLWAKRGLNVKSIFISGIGSLNATISGSVDFSEPSAVSLTRAAAHGQRLLAIAGFLDRPVVQIVLRKDLAEAAGFDPKAPLAQRAKILRGRTIAVDSINSVIHAYVRVIAKRGGFDPDDIRIAPMEPNSALAAFATKAVDGFAMSMPWPLKPVEEGTAVVIASGPDGDPPDIVPFGHAVLVARPETCATRKSVCEKMAQGIADAAAVIRDRPDDAIAVLAKRFPTIDAKLLAAAFAEIRKATPVPPIVTKAEIENSDNFNVAAGLMKPEDKLKSYDGLYTDAFLK